MKKCIKCAILLSIFVTAMTASAQEVNTSMIDFAKTQIPGYLVNVPNATIELADGAFRNMMENQYGLKASKESGFRAYLNQNFRPFGTENFDIYYTVTEFGKKKSRTTQLVLIVCTGNMNAVTPANNPETDKAIKSFLAEFAPKVQAYGQRLKAEQLKQQISKIESSKNSVEKEQEKTTKQIEKLNQSLGEMAKKKADYEKQISELQAELKDIESKLP